MLIVNAKDIGFLFIYEGMRKHYIIFLLLYRNLAVIGEMDDVDVRRIF